MKMRKLRGLNNPVVSLFINIYNIKTIIFSFKMDDSSEQIEKDISDLRKEYVRIWKQKLDIDVNAIKIKYNESNKCLIY